MISKVKLVRRTYIDSTGQTKYLYRVIADNFVIKITDDEEKARQCYVKTVRRHDPKSETSKKSKLVEEILEETVFENRAN